VLSHRYEVLTVVTMKTTIFQEVMLIFTVLSEESAVLIFVAQKT
jgi:hypothetical protein